MKKLEGTRRNGNTSESWGGIMLPLFTDFPAFNQRHKSHKKRTAKATQAFWLSSPPSRKHRQEGGWIFPPSDFWLPSPPKKLGKDGREA